MTEILQYAPIVLVVLGFILQHRIFVTPADVQKEKAVLLEYIADHYVSIKTCNSQNAHMNDSIGLIREDIKHLADLIEQRIRQSEAK